VDQVGGEEAAGDLADADPRLRTHGRADRVRPALVAVADDAAQGERLAGLEAVVLDQVLGDVEGDRNGVVGELLHSGDRQRMELRPSAGADRCVGDGHVSSSVAPRSFRSSLAGARCDARSLSRHVRSP
jgi:hypothetical protein